MTVLVALVLLAVLVVAGVFWLRVRSDTYAAKHREPSPPRLPRQLVSRSLDFDEYGRTW